MGPTPLVAAYERAFNDDDADAMNDLFAEDAVFVNFSGRVVRGRAALLAAQRAVFAPGGPLHGVRVRYDVELVTPLGDELCAVHARQVADDPALEAVFLAVVGVADGGGWRIRIGQNTPVSA